MPRFDKNRWWNVILALSLSLACCVALAHPATAEGGLLISDIGFSQGDGGAPPPSGDPDVPTGSGKASPRGSAYGQGSTYGMFAAGDGRASGSAVMMRFHVVLQVLKSFYFRF